MTLANDIEMRVNTWIDWWSKLMNPKDIVYCDGSDEQYRNFCDQMISEGRMIKLNEQNYENCYLCRSDPNDVARTEDRTFICCKNKSDAGLTNNWMNPSDAKNILESLFQNTMTGRTMYVIPFFMGNPNSPIAQFGIQLTDSLYVAISMRSMAKIIDLKNVSQYKINNFIKCIHSVGAPLYDGLETMSWPCNKTKYICHFPETNEIISYGSGYGGNALLGKKCLALRIASNIGKRDGWLAEHMLILKLTNPDNVVKYITAAFPSSCGKTNLAMLQSKLTGWKIECIGDDIAWMYVNPKDSRLYAINPENGFFGVVPGTSYKTNPVVMKMIKRNTIFTNVGLTPDLNPVWEGMGDSDIFPDNTVCWDGILYDKGKKVAHPNSRFTTACKECDILADEYNDPMGVPISAIIFGGRRKDTIPLLSKAKDWKHGVFFGASLSSETTAAATGAVGIVRNDPFAMLPFCGYNMKDYFNHWIEIGNKVKDVNIYMVNWFRKNTNGKFIWNGFGDNIYVLKSIFNNSDIISNDELKIIYNTNNDDDIKNIKKQLFDVTIDEIINEKNRIREYFSKIEADDIFDLDDNFIFDLDNEYE